MKRKNGTPTLPESPTNNKKYIRGTLNISERKVTVDTKTDNYFIPRYNRNLYVHGDQVFIEIIRSGIDGKLPEANIVELACRTREDILVEIRYKRGKPHAFAINELGGMSVKIQQKNIFRPHTGDIFIATFVDTVSVRILKKYGNRNELSTQENILLFRHHVRQDWNDEIKNAKIPVLQIPEEIQKTNFDDVWNGSGLLPENIKLENPKFFVGIDTDADRLDFRTWTTITIDGEDARDLDDAISIARYTDGDFLLGVHIADVTEYVTVGTAIDTEACLRGTSIYIPRKVIPMLPEILSNDRCSLHPGEPKAVLSCLIRVDKNSGKVRETRIVKGVISSDHRGTYTEIMAKRGSSDRSGWQYILSDLWSLYDILSTRRKKEGKIAFDSTEVAILFNNKGLIDTIKKREHNQAHELIEAFMVLANEEVAKWCEARKIPFLSRVHESPGTEQESIIRSIIGLTDETLESRHISAYLERQGTSEQYRLSRLLLPKMSKAIYRDTSSQHFGLALTHYAHFTSPIRRYPDLLLHRTIKSYLNGDLGTLPKKQLTEKLKHLGKTLTECEKKAEVVERATVSLLMCEYMSDKIGKIFDGTISGISESNIYVELGSGIEGSIFLGNEKGKYRMNPIDGTLSDIHGKEIAKIGNTIQVKIISVDKNTRRIEMGTRESTSRHK